jgi:hypothetical protein
MFLIEISNPRLKFVQSFFISFRIIRVISDPRVIGKSEREKQKIKKKRICLEFFTLDRICCFYFLNRRENKNLSLFKSLSIIISVIEKE